MPAERNLDSLYRGDAYEHILTFQDADGDAIDVTGTWRAQIRRRQNSADVLAEFTIDDSDAATGVLVLTLDGDTVAGLPDVCVWDLEETGAQLTYLKGTVRVSGQVSAEVTP